MNSHFKPIKFAGWEGGQSAAPGSPRGQPAWGGSAPPLNRPTTAIRVNNSSPTTSGHPVLGNVLRPLTQNSKLETRNSKLLIQLVPINDALEEEAYLNAEVFSLGETSVRVVLAEHLVAIMLKVGRAKDLARMAMFLSQDAVDRETLRDIIKRHGLEDKWERFESKSRS